MPIRVKAWNFKGAALIVLKKRRSLFNLNAMGCELPNVKGFEM